VGERSGMFPGEGAAPAHGKATGFTALGVQSCRVSAQAMQQVDHTAAWLAFAGVLAVATIAAATAQWRQWAEHKHDRAMRDLHDLRIVLDHGYDAADGALRSLTGAREEFRQHVNNTVTPMLPSVTPENLATWSPEQHERYREQLQQLEQLDIENVLKPLAKRAGEHIQEVGLLLRRLAIRLGPDDPVTKDLGAVLDALQAMLDAVMAQPEMLKGTDRATELEAAAAEARLRGEFALAAYAIDARNLVGARLKG
jgi:hypothetical protein